MRFLNELRQKHERKQSEKANIAEYNVMRERNKQAIECVSSIISEMSFDTDIVSDGQALIRQIKLLDRRIEQTLRVIEEQQVSLYGTYARFVEAEARHMAEMWDSMLAKIRVFATSG